jgi:hypothetical protein
MDTNRNDDVRSCSSFVADDNVDFPRMYDVVVVGGGGDDDDDDDDAVDEHDAHDCDVKDRIECVR